MEVRLGELQVDQLIELRGLLRGQPIQQARVDAELQRRGVRLCLEPVRERDGAVAEVVPLRPLSKERPAPGAQGSNP